VKTSTSSSRTCVPKWPGSESSGLFWGALQGMVYHCRRWKPVQELKSAIVVAWQQQPQAWITALSWKQYSVMVDTSNKFVRPVWLKTDDASLDMKFCIFICATTDRPIKLLCCSIIIAHVLLDSAPVWNKITKPCVNTYTVSKKKGPQHYRL